MANSRFESSLGLHLVHHFLKTRIMAWLSASLGHGIFRQALTVPDYCLGKAPVWQLLQEKSSLGASMWKNVCPLALSWLSCSPLP